MNMGQRCSMLYNFRAQIASMEYKADIVGRKGMLKLVRFFIPAF